jgi:hypothetical protein
VPSDLPSSACGAFAVSAEDYFAGSMIGLDMSHLERRAAQTDLLVFILMLLILSVPRPFKRRTWVQSRYPDNCFEVAFPPK